MTISTTLPSPARYGYRRYLESGHDTWDIFEVNTDQIVAAVTVFDGDPAWLADPESFPRFVIACLNGAAGLSFLL